MRRYLAFFGAGFLLGACLFNLLVAQQQEQLYLDQTELLLQLNRAEDEISQLKENLAEKTDQVVTSIEPIVDFEDEKLTSVETRVASQVISEQVEKFLEPLVGQEIRNLNAALIPNLVAGRRVKANGTELKLDVKLVLISEKLIIQVEAAQERSGP